ncbi:hypothetical protein MMC13_005430 [Lambiella insularis]|nr:hypothetical protein [Lambiella insularis]
MESAGPTPAAPREIIEIDSDTDDDENAFGPFLDLAAIDQAFPGVPDYRGSDSSDGEQGSAPVTNVTAPAPVEGLSVTITDPELLYQQYLGKVLEVFPDVCRSHLKLLYDTHTADLAPNRSKQANDQVSQAVIVQILDSEKYPKEEDRRKKLKRKRTDDADGEEEEEEEEHGYAKLSRARLTAAEISDARILLLWEFDTVPLTFIDLQLKLCGTLYTSYLAIELAQRNYDQTLLPPYKKLVKSRRSKPVYNDFMLTTDATGYGTVELQKELLAAKRKREREMGECAILRSNFIPPFCIYHLIFTSHTHVDIRADLVKAKIRQQQAEAEADAALEKECMEKGQMVECQCCFTDTPIPKSTHCDESHFFCLECARSHVKSQIELSRYEITCIDGSGCKAAFTRNEKHRFLDAKLVGVLDRLQQQADLRVANMEGLESCPFCDYAAICPPVEVDREFRCKMPDCEIISCRVCKAKTHLPLSCAEYKKEQGVSERHILEEAMTNALVRPCPKCGVPILKDGGCNKMVCSKCRTFVCDYCGKDISKEGYSHFDNGVFDPASGRKKKCPTQDDTFGRNQKRVEEAQKEAMEKVRAENPDLCEEDLKIKFSAEVANERNPDGYHVGAVPPAWRPDMDELRHIQARHQQQIQAMQNQRAIRREAARARHTPATRPEIYPPAAYQQQPTAGRLAQADNVVNMTQFPRTQGAVRTAPLELPVPDARTMFHPFNANHQAQQAAHQVMLDARQNMFDTMRDTRQFLMNQMTRDTAMAEPQRQAGRAVDGDANFIFGPNRARNARNPPMQVPQPNYNPYNPYPPANATHPTVWPVYPAEDAPLVFGGPWRPNLPFLGVGGFNPPTADRAFPPRTRRQPGGFE